MLEIPSRHGWRQRLRNYQNSMGTSSMRSRLSMRCVGIVRLQPVLGVHRVNWRFRENINLYRRRHRARRSHLCQLYRLYGGYVFPRNFGLTTTFLTIILARKAVSRTTDQRQGGRECVVRSRRAVRSAQQSEWRRGENIHAK